MKYIDCGMDVKHRELSTFYSFQGNYAPSRRNQSCRFSRVNVLVATVLIIGLLITFLNIYQLQQMKEEHIFHAKNSHPITVVEGAAGRSTRNAPVVWIYGKHLETGYLDHVKAVFERLGFFITNGDEDWDVLWVHDYPFVTMSKIMTTLKPHQKVNHFPGSGFITNKGSLATLQLEAFPRAFRIPKDKEKLLEYAQKHSDAMWVQKNNNHRGVKIRQIKELDFESDGSFVQEFVSKPLLIDQRKFDIGVYVILTSLNPLRVYKVHDESLFRFCSKNYHPFDVADVDKYVVHDDYTPMWEMPSMMDMYVNKKYSFKETFNRYMINQGKNVSKIWEDIHSTIRAVYLKKQPTLMSSGAKYKTTKNFFELVRFDFVLDENLKVYLMEVNMSPNLSTGHFQGNRRLYEHVVYNVLRVTGIASVVENHFHSVSTEEEEMLVSEREITVFSDWCSLPDCQGKCDKLRCSLCSECVSSVQRTEFQEAYLEHINRAGSKRLFPPEINALQAQNWDPDHDSFQLSTYNDKTRVMYMWFIGMCRKDPSFCA